jgi:hypothetical protein
VSLSPVPCLEDSAKLADPIIFSSNPVVRAG